jgi:hypothetical protein
VALPPEGVHPDLKAWAAMRASLVALGRADWAGQS